MADEFDEKQIAEEQRAGLAARLDDGSPLGAGPDGRVELLPPGSAPLPFEPRVVSAGEPEQDDDFADLEPEAER